MSVTTRGIPRVRAAKVAKAKPLEKTSKRDDAREKKRNRKDRDNSTTPVWELQT